MYNEKLAVAIRVDGQVLRERGDTVYLPFGTEYEIYFRNMGTTKAVISVEVDGTDVLDGSRLIVNPAKTASIKRFIKNGNLASGRALKFIEKTEKVSEFRGDKIEDGLIRVEYQFEKPPVQHIHDLYYPPYVRLKSMWDSGYQRHGVVKGMSFDSSVGSDLGAWSSAQSVSMVNDAGITVEGSKSDQSFSHGYIGALEYQKHSMVIKLLGKTKDNQVTQVITTKTKIKCPTCGKKNKSSNKYCVRCGTYLGS
jgi:hypothetical protein